MIGFDTTEEPPQPAELHRHSVSDCRPEGAFDELTNLASLICTAPIAFLSLADSGRIWCKSKVGLSASQISRIDGFCSSVILSDGLLIVPDVTADDRFASHLLVAFAPNLRFYAGAPLITARGQRIGFLCVIDTVARQIDEDQSAALQSIARTITSQFELQRSANQSVEAEQLLRDIQSRTESQIAERTSQLSAAHHSLQLLTRQLM
jgi:GAF domain-containing protein